MNATDIFNSRLWAARSCRTCDRLRGDYADSGTTYSGKVTCALCFKTVGNMYELVVHVRNHNGIRPFACSRCSESFASVALLMLHRYVNHGGSVEGHYYLCSKCNVWIEGIGQYGRHVKLHRSRGLSTCWALCSPRTE